MIQKSYDKNENGILYLIPTPIGNLKDITFRAIEVLKEVDVVFAEDTRETRLLLSNYNISKKVESCHKYSEMKNKDKLIAILKSGQTVAYVTDRGTPLISDPGNIIVDYAIKNNINVVALPGPNALLPAINMSGISNERFLFYGFLNSKKSIAKRELLDLCNIKQTLIFYESPFRVKDTLSLMLSVFGNRKCAIVREISKIHEEIMRDNFENLIKMCDNIKGEIVIVVEGNKEDKKNDLNQCVDLVNKLIKEGYSKKDAIREIANKYNIRKNELYNKMN